MSVIFLSYGRVPIVMVPGHLLSSLRLHLPPQRHEHQAPDTQESELQPDIAGHSHVYPCTSPNRAQNPTAIVAVLNEQASLPVP